MQAVVTHKDLITAILGASSALAGFALVFLGVVLAAATFDPGTKVTIITKALKPARAVVASFAIGVACLTFAMIWLLYPWTTGYWITVGLFFVQLASLVATTGWVVRRALWG